MQAYLPKPVFKSLAAQMAGNGLMNKETADAVAHAVKVWAMERGATHFTHWFQPQNNQTAEKHDSFLSLNYGSLHNNLTVRLQFTPFGRDALTILGDCPRVLFGEPVGPGRAGCLQLPPRRNQDDL
jgi:hypothetical protein